MTHDLRADLAVPELGGTEPEELGDLGVPLALAGVEVEVDAVLGHLGLVHPLEEEPVV